MPNTFLKHLISFVQQPIKGLLNLIYPPFCMHCQGEVEVDSRILCSTCIGVMSLINPQERCPLCFTDQYALSQSCCYACSKKRPPLKQVAAAFDYAGPAGTLVKRMKYSDKPYLAKILSSYLIAQLCQMDWPLPDLIVPVPLTTAHWFERGYNQSALLSKHISETLNIPYKEVIKRVTSDYSQAGLNYQQRMMLSEKGFHLKKGMEEFLYDKRILIVDDVMTTGSTFRCCALACLEASPKDIYGIAVCRALK